MRARALVFASLVAGSAYANGKIPDAGQLVVDPTNASHLALRTTFGLLVTENAGLDWHWICEKAAGYANVEPGIVLSENGSLLLGVNDGVSVGAPPGCAFAHAGGVSEWIDDLAVRKQSPSTVVGVSTFVGGGSCRVYETSDNGGSFSAIGTPIPGTFDAKTIEVTSVDPERIYVSGVEGAVDKLARSPDRGKSWALFEIPDDTTAQPYIVAVDPNDADVVYVLIAGSASRLLVSQDAGEKWSEIFAPKAFIQAVTLSPDGKTLLVGGGSIGVQRASTSDYVFTQVSKTNVHCLTWATAGVYACGANGSPFWVGLSTDAGKTFEPVLRQDCVRGPLACPATSPFAASCPSEWPAIESSIGGIACKPPPVIDAGEAGVDVSEPGYRAAGGCSVALGSNRFALASGIALVLLALFRRRR